MKNFVLPTNDYAFKAIFANEKNKIILINFICAVLKIKEKDVKNLIVKNPDLPKDVNSEQDIKLDLVIEIVVNKEIKMINIEMQCIVYHSFVDRTLFYWAKLHASQDSVKANYTKLKPTIGIYIVKEKMFEIDKFHLIFSLLEKTCYIEYSKNLELHVLQLSANLTKEDQNLLNWNKFFNIKNETDINNIKNEDVIMKQVCEALESFNYDEQEKIMALSREKAVWERNNLYYDGIEKGEENIIKKMLLEKLDINLISKISNLSVEEIEKIKKELY